MAKNTDLIYTVFQIEEEFGRSRATVYRVLGRHEAACFGPVVVDNLMGGERAVRGGQRNSLTALFALHDAEVGSLRAEVGRRGGLQQAANRNAASSAVQCSSGDL